MKKEQEGFFLTLETACEFYKLCEDKKANTYDDRLTILRQFVKDKKAKYLRDVQEVLEGKTVLEIRVKKEK